MSSGRNPTVEVVVAVITIGLYLVFGIQRCGFFKTQAVAAPVPPAVVAQNECQDGSAEACDRGGDYAKACRLGSADGCDHSGREFEDSGHPARAATLYDRACGLGSARSCAARDALYLAGKAVPDDPAVAIGWYVKRCETGDVVGCAQAGVHYAEQKDDARALPFLNQACDAQNALACSTLGRQYADGRGVTRSDVIAVAKFRVACNGDPTYCFSLASAYDSGRGATRDHAKAMALYTQACNAGNSAACAAVRAP